MLGCGDKPDGAVSVEVENGCSPDGFSVTVDKPNDVPALTRSIL